MTAAAATDRTVARVVAPPPGIRTARRVAGLLLSLLVLGVVHFANVMVFNSIRRRHRFEQSTVPPVAPQRVVPGAFAPYPGAHPAPGS